METCKICGREFKRISCHLKSHEISPKDYFIQYLNNGIVPVCYCGKETGFKTINQGFRKYCSTYCLCNSEERKEKLKETCKNNFGVENPTQSKIVQEKIKQTNLDRRGCECSFQSEEVKEKIKETSQERFGTDYPMQNKEVQEKKKKTCLKVYGKEYAIQTEEGKEKQKKTCLKIYGKEFACQSEGVKKRIKETLLKINTENANKIFSEMGFEIVSEYKTGKTLTIFKCKNCNFEFEVVPFNLYSRAHKCPVCDPVEISQFEQEVRDNIIKHLITKFNKRSQIIYNDRTVLSPYEIDILIPEFQLSIEVNGDYWHSLPGIPERDQWKAETMISKGYKHFIIKECDWNDNKSDVLQKFDQLIDLDFENYSENIFYFTGFDL